MTAPDRLKHELEHGRKIAAVAGTVWGHESYAGRLRVLRRIDLMRQAADLRPGRRAIELGCGIGIFTRELAVTGASIVAIDLVPELLERARASTTAPNVSFVQGDCTRLEELPEARGVDVVVANSVLHHLDLEASLRSILSVLAPGGTLVLSEPNLLNPQLLFVNYAPPLRRRLGWSPDEKPFVRWGLARRLRRTGFTQVSVRPFDFLHPSTPRALAWGVDRLGWLLERLPLVRELSGSLFIVAHKPA